MLHQLYHVCTTGTCGIKEVSGSEMAVPQAKLMIFDSTSLQFKQGTGIAEAASLLTIVRLWKYPRSCMCCYVLDSEKLVSGQCSKQAAPSDNFWPEWRWPPQLMMKNDVYQNHCCACDSIYIGETSRDSGHNYAVKNSDRENGVAACMGWGTHCRLGRSLNNLDCARTWILAMNHTTPG